MRTRDNYDNLTRGSLVTRADIAHITGVAEATVQSWAQDREPKGDRPGNGFPATIRRGGRQVVWHNWGEVLDWLCSTGRSECGLEEGMVDLKGVAAYFGVADVTVKMWRGRELFPPPDLTLGRSPYWKTETLDRWERPRRRQKVTTTP